jgi:hypothetical protein
MLVDGQQRFTRAGLEVYLRVQNFAPQGDFQEMGVPYVTTEGSGYTDILIDPPPQVVDVSMHNIGMSGGKLLLGARSFIVSHTFVQVMREKNPGIPDDIAVWFNWDGQTPVVGIVYENRMHEIVLYTHKEIAGETVSWKLTCNRVDVALDKGATEGTQTGGTPSPPPPSSGGEPSPSNPSLVRHEPTMQPNGSTPIFTFLGVPASGNLDSVEVFLGGILQDSDGGDCSLAIVNGNVQATFTYTPSSGRLIAYY